jgi:hypothetical protein
MSGRLSDETFDGSAQHYAEHEADQQHNCWMHLTSSVVSEEIAERDERRHLQKDENPNVLMDLTFRR